MKKTQWIAVCGLLAFAVIVSVLMLRNRQPPAMLDNTDHTWRGADGCLVCHGPNGRAPRTPNHPVGRECLRCHAVAP